MQNRFLVIIPLLLITIMPASALYEPPTSRERDLFSQLLGKFEKTDVPKEDVTDVVRTFDRPLIVSFQCNSNDTNDFVVVVITTRLARFEQTPVHEDQVTGGSYTWDCLATTEDAKVTLQCNNDLRLNTEVLLNSTGVNPEVHQVENEMVLYHELLHGQLMINAIKSSAAWRQEICNRIPGQTIDFSYADPDHKIINPLQSQFASELMREDGGEMITRYLLPNETQDGMFSTTIFRISDFPQFREGGEVTLRAVNIDDTTFEAANNVLILNGTLVNKTEPGIAWFYILNGTGGQGQGRMSLVAQEKRTAGLWANGNVSDLSFYGVLQNMTGAQGHEGGDIPQPLRIPFWLRNAANWWYEGRIDDNTFINLVRYLASQQIIS